MEKERPLNMTLVTKLLCKFWIRFCLKFWNSSFKLIMLIFFDVLKKHNIIRLKGL